MSAGWRPARLLLYRSCAAVHRSQPRAALPPPAPRRSVSHSPILSTAPPLGANRSLFTCWAAAASRDGASGQEPAGRGPGTDSPPSTSYAVPPQVEKARVAALQKAIRILDYRMRSRAELREKLIEAGHAAEHADYAVRQVVAMKLQSDAELADSIVRNKWRTAKWARPRIAVALRQRGIERAEAQVALDALFVRGEGIGVVGLYRDEAEEGDDVGGGGAWGDEGGIDTPLEKDLYKAALRQWRLSANTTPENRYRRVSGWIARRGHPWGMVSKIMTRLRDEPEEEE